MWLFAVQAGLERLLGELRERARRLEELLPCRVSSEEQREVLGLLCKVHELEIENAEMQSHTLLKDNVIRQKDVVVQRFAQHRQLCHEIIQQQRQFIDSEWCQGRTEGKLCCVIWKSTFKCLLMFINVNSVFVSHTQITVCWCLHNYRSCMIFISESWMREIWIES